MQVRNEFRLWQGNAALLRSCGVSEPEECSGIIFDRLWETLRTFADSGLVRALDCQFKLSEGVQIRYAGFYRLRLAEILDSVQAQIDRQLPRLRSTLPASCSVAVGLQLRRQDRKSTRLNSSHMSISYAVFCLKKKKKKT